MSSSGYSGKPSQNFCVGKCASVDGAGRHRRSSSGGTGAVSIGPSPCAVFVWYFTCALVAGLGGNALGFALGDQLLEELVLDHDGGLGQLRLGEATATLGPVPALSRRRIVVVFFRRRGDERAQAPGQGASVD